MPPIRPDHGRIGTCRTQCERASRYRMGSGSWSLLPVGVSTAVRLIGSVGMRGVADGPVVPLLALQPEAGLLCGPLHDEGQRDGLLAVIGVVGVDPDVVLRLGLAA